MQALGEGVLSRLEGEIGLSESSSWRVRKKREKPRRRGGGRVGEMVIGGDVLGLATEEERLAWSTVLVNL